MPDTPADAGRPSGPVPPAAAPSAHGHALPVTSYEKGLTVCVRNPPAGVTGYFQVSTDQALRLDGLVRAELQVTKVRRKIEGDPARYARQYIGLNRGDRPVIFVNAVYPVPPDVRMQVANDCSGAYTFFGMEYDLSFERFENLSTGPARTPAKPDRRAGSRSLTPEKK